MSRVALILLCVIGLAGGGLAASGADFTAHSSSTSSFTAAADFNTVTVGFSNPGTTLIGSVNLAATASSDRGIASVKFEQAPANTADWVEICVDGTPSYDCAWSTTAVADGVYDLRVTATDTAGYTKSATLEDRTVDNHTLSVSLADPGAMSGSENLTATAANASGGLQWLRIEHRAPGATSWTTLCSGTTSPRACSLDTTALPEGGRELRATARDVAGHEVVSATITRTVDNTPPSSTPNIPPTGTGNVIMQATATDSGSGIAYVAFEALYMGTWYEFCRDTSSPYTCSGDSAQVADGTYSIRVVTADHAGVRTTSAPQQIAIDNPPKGTEVVTGNGGITAGLLEAGDWIRLSWNEQINPGSVLAGWNGSSVGIVARVTDSTTNDRLDFYSAGGTRLNLVLGATDLQLRGDFVSANTEFAATMAQSGGAITVTLGAISYGTLQTAAAGTITWRPSSSAKDLAGKASSTTQVNEAGGADVDF